MPKFEKSPLLKLGSFRKGMTLSYTDKCMESYSSQLYCDLFMYCLMNWLADPYTHVSACGGGFFIGKLRNYRILWAFHSSKDLLHFDII
ncbi:hypothetical protein CSV74_15520 [Sporosarcina sp. P19]|uniref:Uncharacterized protein n=1 Tax=Sporosarcina ureae TaxID=1571 RepID=A0ABM6JTM4_SPOUR|nr:hypothetical protein SporoS204_04610 [Sporosarcina ureae]PIC75563.1 hypothetical protein CSV74_15520 [Sporosarcina sp. P19]